MKRESGINAPSSLHRLNTCNSVYTKKKQKRLLFTMARARDTSQEAFIRTGGREGNDDHISRDAERARSAQGSAILILLLLLSAALTRCVKTLPEVYSETVRTSSKIMKKKGKTLKRESKHGRIGEHRDQQ